MIFIGKLYSSSSQERWKYFEVVAKNNKGSGGTEVPQWGPEAKPQYGGLWDEVPEAVDFCLHAIKF